MLLQEKADQAQALLAETGLDCRCVVRSMFAPLAEVSRRDLLRLGGLLAAGYPFLTTRS
jgi:hypothetical protein